MSNIVKGWKKINSSGLRIRSYTMDNPTEISKRKGIIRRRVEKEIITNDNQLYDRDDQLADLSNAFNALLMIATSNGWNISGNSYITKYLTRKSSIDGIKDSVDNP